MLVDSKGMPAIWSGRLSSAIAVVLITPVLCGALLAETHFALVPVERIEPSGWRARSGAVVVLHLSGQRRDSVTIIKVKHKGVRVGHS
jgi:hypothetical protein